MSLYRITVVMETHNIPNSETEERIRELLEENNEEDLRIREYWTNEIDY